MDVGTIIGLICAFGALGIAVILEGGHLGSFFNVPAGIIVFGGTTCAVIVSTPVPILARAPRALMLAFFGSKLLNPREAVTRLIALSRRARREGLLALESSIAEAGDEFLKKGLQLVVDGTDAEVLQSILTSEIRNRSHRHQQTSGIFGAMGGLAPTLGVTGTVMGLVHMMENLSDPSSMGPAIAGAFIATLYGVASANVVFLPIANKLKARSDAEKAIHALMLEGLVSLQNGENVITIEERLKAHLPPALRDTGETPATDTSRSSPEERNVA
jgi:chemotaxis protein MotA